jgi:hypothetical protein
MADAIDRQHADCVHTVNLISNRQGCTLRLQGQGDLLLAKRALEKRSDLFEEIFGKLVIEEPPAHRPVRSRRML